jgi:general secretion pathway protein D
LRLPYAGRLHKHFSADKIDPAGDLTRADYLALRHRGEELKNEDLLPPLHATPPIPSLPTAPPPPKTKLPEKTVSLSVTDSTPLRSVLMELGREGKLNLEIDPRIQGGILFTAHDQPFEKVLRRICALAGLRFKAEGDFIRVELDDRTSIPILWTSCLSRAVRPAK